MLDRQLCCYVVSLHFLRLNLVRNPQTQNLPPNNRSVIISGKTRNSFDHLALSVQSTHFPLPYHLVIRAPHLHDRLVPVSVRHAH